MLKKVLILVLIVAMLSLASCKVVEVIDHGTTLPPEETTQPTEHDPWGFWYCSEHLGVLELTEGSNTAKIYSITPGYYEYDEIIEASCSFDGDATFTISEGGQTHSFVFDKYANVMKMSDATYLHTEKAPTEHKKLPFPDYLQMEPSTYISVDAIDYTSLSSLILEGAPYEIAMAYYKDLKNFSKAEGLVRPAQSGDTVNIDYCGKLDGVAFNGGTATGVTLFISDYQNGYIPGFTEGIIGHAVGETFDVNVTFPQEYHAPDLAGKAVVFTMTLNYICDMTLSDEKVAEYKENDYKTYGEWLEAKKTEIAKDLLYDTILEASDSVKLPQEAYAFFYAQTVDYYHLVAYYYNLDYETFMLYTGLTENAILKQALSQATYNMALYVIAEENGIVCTEEDYAAKYEKYVTDYLKTYQDASREEACKYADEYITQMKHELTEEKVIAWAMTQIFPKVTE